jgi:hypothetical protein
VLALTCCVELFTQAHYRESIEPDDELSDLYRDIFRFHWLEECQHAVMDEIEWSREDRSLSATERERAVNELIELIGRLDQLLRAQAASDAAYFLRLCEREFTAAEQRLIREGVLRAYRWQYIASGAGHPHFRKVFEGLASRAQVQRFNAAIEALTADC